MTQSCFADAYVIVLYPLSSLNIRNVVVNFYFCRISTSSFEPQLIGIPHAVSYVGEIETTLRSLVITHVNESSVVFPFRVFCMKARCHLDKKLAKNYTQE